MFWNGLTGAPEPFRRAVTPDYYTNCLPQSVQPRAEPNCPNISDVQLFRNRGWRLEGLVQLWPVYDRTEHRGRSQLLNAWNPSIIFGAPETMVQAIAYILCGITLPKAFVRTFISALRNGFTHLEEFSKELRQQLTDAIRNALPQHAHPNSLPPTNQTQQEVEVVPQWTN